MAGYLAKPPHGSPLNRADPCGGRLYAAYPLADKSGPTARNPAGKPDAVLLGGAAWVTGLAGPAVDCSGGGYVSTGLGVAGLTAGAIVIDFTPAVSWSSNQNYGLCYNGPTGPPNSPESLIWRWNDAGGALRVYTAVGSTGAFGNIDTARTSWAAGTRYQIAFAWDGTTQRLYDAGLLVATLTRGWVYPDEVSLQFGRGANGTTPLPFPGVLNAAYVLRGPVTARQARDLYADPYRTFRRRRVPVPLRPAGGGTSDATGSSLLAFAASAAGSALTTSAGSSPVVFTPTAAGSSLAAAAGTSALTFTPAAAGSALTAATGTATLAFAASGVGNSLAAGSGTAALTFTPGAAGGSLATAAGSSSLTFTASGAGGTAGTSTGTATLALGASATGGSLAAGSGTAGVVFTPTGVGSSLAAAAGSSALTFVASAAGAIAASTGAAAVVFGGSGVGSALVAAAGTAGLVFTATGVGAGGTPVTALPGGTFRRRDTARAFRRLGDAARVFRGYSRMADSIQRTTLVKDAGETVSYLFSFDQFPEYLAGETLSSPSVPAVSGLTIGTPAVTLVDRDYVAAGAGIAVTISGGTGGGSYSLECFGTFSGGSIRCVKGVLQVEA